MIPRGVSRIIFHQGEILFLGGQKYFSQCAKKICPSLENICPWDVSDKRREEYLIITKERLDLASVPIRAFFIRGRNLLFWNLIWLPLCPRLDTPLMITKKNITLKGATKRGWILLMGKLKIVYWKIMAHLNGFEKDDKYIFKV